MPHYKPLPGVYIDCILEANETAADYEDDDSDAQDDTEELCPTCSGTGRLSDTTHRPQFDPTQKPTAELRSARSRRKEASVYTRSAAILRERGDYEAARVAATAAKRILSEVKSKELP